MCVCGHVLICVCVACTYMYIHINEVRERQKRLRNKTGEKRYTQGKIMNNYTIYHTHAIRAPVAVFFNLPSQGGLY